MSRAALLLACALFGSALMAQQHELTLERRGSIAFVNWRADVIALEAITQLANAGGLTLKIQPEALGVLQSELLDLNVRGALISDCAQSIAAACGLVAAVQSGELNVQAVPQEGVAAERLRRAAVEWYGRAALENPRAGREDDTAFRAAMLEFDGGALESALAGFRVFAEGHRGAPLCARAWLMAGSAAFLLERYAEARTALEHLDDTTPDNALLSEGALLTARSFLAEGRSADALPRLRRAADKGAPRISALASLLEAELSLAAGDAVAALDILERVARRLDRAEPDLAQRIPLWSGRVLLALNQPRAAVTQLQTAMLTCGEKIDRDEAALGLMQAYRACGDNVAALLAARALLGMAPVGATLRNALEQIGGLQAELGLADAAVATYERLLSECPDGDALAQRALLGLAQTLVTERRWDEARDLFSALGMRSDVGQRALLEVARCDVAMAAHERALGVLQRVNDPVLSAPVRELQARALSALGRHREASEVLGGRKEKQ